jgi:thiamine kinase-like enzyme
MDKTDYTVGPFAPPVQLETPRVRRGPWQSAREEMKTWIQDQLEELRYHPERIISRRQENKVANCPPIIEEFEEIYSAVLALIEEVKLLDRCDPSWCPYSLFHPDLTLNNIMVDISDPTRVIALIDWEGARVQPWVGNSCVKLN